MKLILIKRQILQLFNRKILFKPEYNIQVFKYDIHDSF